MPDTSPCLVLSVCVYMCWCVRLRVCVYSLRRQALDPVLGEGDKTRESKTEMVKNLFSGLMKKGGQISGVSEEEIDYRRHPLYACVTLMLLQEVLNRRLFSTVR